MNKILLVYEDYADLMALESTLKKVGFDVLGVSSEYAMAEQMLAFNPEVVVGSGRGGGKVSTLGVGKRLKEMTRWSGKAILIFPANMKPNPQDLLKIRVDMMLESPVAPLRILQVLAKLLGQEEAVLLERLNKNMHADGSAATKNIISGSGKFSPEDEAIYVRGNTDPVNIGKEIPLTRGLDEDNEEAGQDFKLDTSTGKSNFKFRFGERMTEADRETNDSVGIGKESSTADFPDVDLSSLENELLGGGVPTVEKVDLNSVPEESNEIISKIAKNMGTESAAEIIRDSSSEEKKSAEEISEAVSAENDIIKVVGSKEVESPANAQIQTELQLAKAGMPERMAKYREMVADVKVTPKSNLTRVEARRRQRELAAHWNQENISELDELRREFTTALFKK